MFQSNILCFNGDTIDIVFSTNVCFVPAFHESDQDPTSLRVHTKIVCLLMVVVVVGLVYFIYSHHVSKPVS